jgi:hypothetical protein
VKTDQIPGVVAYVDAPPNASDRPPVPFENYDPNASTNLVSSPREIPNVWFGKPPPSVTEILVTEVALLREEVAQLREMIANVSNHS